MQMDRTRTNYFRKFKLANTPLLKYSDFSKLLFLTMNANCYAIGAILSQGKLGKIRRLRMQAES
jgi:regulator of PEP synthase PpsR (kinase-PPPase family)